MAGSESQLSDELIGLVVAAVRPARPAGHGASWEALVPVKAEIAGWVKDDLTLVKIGELLERRGIVVPYRTLARFAAAECGYLLVAAAGDGAGGRREAGRGGPGRFRLPGDDSRRGPAAEAARAGVHRGVLAVLL